MPRKKLPSDARKLEAFEFLSALDTAKKYRLQKISAKEDRPISVYVGVATEGEIELVSAKKMWPGAVGVKKDDFVVRIQGERFRDYIRTSLIHGVGKTDDGIILIETENSIYRLEEVA